ncbi:MAG: CehA/McbA family metallohydrolase, partial [Gammaproteobacteria bacterium]|nr:CehA/McbA family metallohydrolase [Gammaproteobacteria bacterium]
GMSGSIWSVDPETGIATELARSGDYLSSPNWSPDGRWLVYTADPGGGPIQLEILDTHTGETRRLTDDDQIYVDPRFSPDGRRLAYVSTQSNGYFDIYIREIANGSWAGEEVAVSYDNSFGRDRLYFGAWDMHISPAWLPSGDELLIVSNRDVPLGSGNVYRIPARENGIDERVAVLQEQSLYRTQPDVSLDGRRFVYSSTAGAADQFNNLYVQPTTGGEPYKLTFFEHDAFHPRWSPDGEWIAFISNEGGLPQLTLLETYGGALRTVTIQERRWMEPMGTLTVTTLGDNGEPVGARVHLTASDGKHYTPAHEYSRVSRAGDRIFHHAGVFQVELPPGPARMLVTRGFEHEPQEFDLNIEAGENHRIGVHLREISDLSDEGWYSGSTHVHMNYGGNLHNTLENLMMMSEAEDQDVVAEQVANKDNRILDHQFFVPGGGAHPLSRDDMVLVVGQEYRPPFYGHVFMFGMTDHLISPFVTGYEQTAIESLYPSNTDMFRKAKAQGAITGYVHSFFNGDPLEGTLGGAKGFIVDAALEAADAVEWSTPQDGYPPLYAVWSNDIRAAVVGGEDSISNLQATPLVGSMRTYVRTPDGKLSMEGWFDGMRAGHAFVSSGPLLDVRVDGRIPGEELALPAGGREVTVAIRAWGIVPMRTATVVMNGEVVEEIPFGGDRRSLEVERTLRVDRSSWIHVRVQGDPEDRFPLDTSYPLALTNPVWVTVGGTPVRSRSAADYALRWIDKLQTMAELWPGWRSDAEKEHVYAQFDEARAIYRARMEEAAPGT